MKAENFKVAGVTYHEKEIMSLMVDNDEYNLPNNELKELYDDGDKIPQYVCKTDDVQIVKDDLGLKVLVGGVLVGYIKKGSVSHVSNILQDDNTKVSLSAIGIGKYKQIYADHVDTEEYSYPFVHITIKHGSNQIQSQISDIDPTVEKAAPRWKKALYKIALLLWCLVDVLLFFINPIFGVILLIILIVIRVIWKVN